MRNGIDIALPPSSRCDEFSPARRNACLQRAAGAAVVSRRAASAVATSRRPAGAAAGKIGNPAATAPQKKAFALVAFLAAAALMLVLSLGVPLAAAHAEPETASDPFEDAATTELEDGLYQVDVTLEGGSGKATIESPAELEIFGGHGVVKVIWSSPNYDYMIVAEKKYLPTNKTGNSTFVIPVTSYDEPMAIVGDTTAMGDPHEIDYTLTLDAKSIKLYGDSASSSSASSSAQSTESDSGSAGQSGDAADTRHEIPWPWIFFIVCAIVSAVCVGLTIGILRNYRR